LRFQQAAFTDNDNNWLLVLAFSLLAVFVLW